MTPSIIGYYHSLQCWAGFMNTQLILPTLMTLKKTLIILILTTANFKIFNKFEKYCFYIRKTHFEGNINVIKLYSKIKHNFQYCINKNLSYFAMNDCVDLQIMSFDYEFKNKKQKKKKKPL